MILNYLKKHDIVSKVVVERGFFVVESLKSYLFNSKLPSINFFSERFSSRSDIVIT